MTDEGWARFWATVGLVAALIGMVAVWMYLASVRPAFAQEHHHPPQDEAVHLKFYRHWMMPDNRNVSCCHDEDCFPAQAKKENGTWFARKTDDEEWIPIPYNKVDIGLADSPDVPDARAHLCGRRYGGGFNPGGFTVFCFAAGQGG